MSNVVQPNLLYIGRGEVYFDRFDTNGLSTGERFVGNATKVEISTSDDVRDKFSAAEATAPLIASVNVRRTVELALSFDEFGNENLALAFMGAETTLAQTGGSFAVGAPEVITAFLDRWVALSKRQVSLVIVKNAAQNVTYVLDTDYKVDATTGRLYFLSTGAITASQSLKIEYTYATFTGANAYPKVQGGVSNVITGSFRFIGKPATGPIEEIQVWKVTIQPDGAQAFIGDDYGSIGLKARVLADNINHPTEPYYQALKRPS